jgi:PEP-CTERM motif
VNIKMMLSQVMTIRHLKKVKIASVTALAVAALLWVTSTDVGTRAFSQLGIRDSFAQTMAAAQIGLQATGDALNSFIGRSPGERGATDILKGKGKRVARVSGKTADGTDPMQRALGKIFDKPVAGVADPVTPESVAVVLPDETAASVSPVADLPPLASVFPRIIVPGVGNIAGGGGGSGSGGGTGGVDPTVPTVPTVVGSVPEPSTWILLLFGFGAVGVSLRRSSTASHLSRRAGHCAKN